MNVEHHTSEVKQYGGDKSNATDIPAPNFLKIALAHAARGYRVFPLLPGGKRPAINNWPERASWEPEDVRKMWAEWDPVVEVERVHDYNVAIATGRTRDGFVKVVDVDRKDGAKGFDTLAELEMLAAEPLHVEETERVQTASGGLHLFYESAVPLANTASKLGPGIDTRGEGGYVVAAGSVVDGKPYVALGGTRKRLPGCWADAIGAAPTAAEKNAEPACELDTPGNIARAIKYLESAPIAISGHAGNDTTLRVALRVKDEGCSEDRCTALLLERWNEGCLPPWSREELEPIVANAYAYGKNAPGSKSPERYDPNDDFDEYIQPELPFEIPVEGAPATSLLRPDRFKEEFFFDVNVDLTRRDLVKNLMMQVGTVGLVGAPNAGKSQIAAHLAYTIASGEPWCGRKTLQGLVIVALGEGAMGYRGRMIALRRVFGHRQIPFCMIPEVPNLLDMKDVRAFVAACRRIAERSGHVLRLVQIDTMTTAAYGGDTNTIETMSRIVASQRYISRELECVVMPIHHLGKDATKGARGSNVFVGDLDTELTIEAAEKGKIVVRQTKQRDFEKGPDVYFKQQGAVIGQDADGEDVTAVFAEWLERPEDDVDDDFGDAPIDLDLIAVLGRGTWWRAAFTGDEDWVGVPLAATLGLDWRTSRRKIEETIDALAMSGRLIKKADAVADRYRKRRPGFRAATPEDHKTPDNDNASAIASATQPRRNARRKAS